MEYRKGEFDESITLRISQFQKEQIEKIVRSNEEKYYNVSHFINSAINEKIRKELK